MKKLVHSSIWQLAIIIIVTMVTIIIVPGCASNSNTEPQPTQSNNPNPTGENQSPKIDNIISEWLAVERGKSTQIKCVAHDPDGDKLTYSWSVNRGSISGKGALATYNSPSSYLEAQIMVSVTDGRGGSEYSSTIISVVCCGAARKNGEWTKP